MRSSRSWTVLHKLRASTGACVLTTVLVWVAHAPLTQAQEEGGGVKPATLVGELNAALNAAPNPTTPPAWPDKLDLAFDNWRNGGSQNLPVIAAAVGLVRGGTSTVSGAVLETWWNQFFACQNGAGCPVANPGNLVYFQGQELGSYTYDWSVLSSVAAVHLWARAHNRSALQGAARLYLRKSLSLDALASSPSPVASYKDNTLNGMLVDGSCTDPACTHQCPRPLFGAPFLALAGARSNSSYFCADSRRIVFAQAIDWPLTNVPAHLEPDQQTALRATLVAKWAALTTPASADNVYGLTISDRALFRGHVNTGNAASTLVAILNQGATRFVQPYHVLAWSDGERASWMMRNPACARCGGSAYAVKFAPGPRQAQYLYPWLASKSSGHRRGLAEWLPSTSGAPARIEAKNCDRNAGEACPSPVHGEHYVWFTWREDAPQYHVLLGPSAPATLLP
jgi:hypothetical protein